MSATTSLRALTCGAAMPEPLDEYSKMLNAIGTQVEDYGEFVSGFKARPSEKDSSYFLPLALRSVMEASCSGVLARIDPIRVMYAAKAQLSPSYDKTVQQGSSLKWDGDMVIKEKEKPADSVGATEKNSSTAPPIPLIASWDPKLGRDKIPRAIFSLNMYEVLWNPAHARFTDWLVTSNSDAVLFRELAALHPTQVRDFFTVKGSKLYSELSKGIHPEFIVRRQAEFDAQTLVELTARTISWVTQMSILTHFSSICNASIDHVTMSGHVELIEGVFIQ